MSLCAKYEISVCWHCDTVHGTWVDRNDDTGHVTHNEDFDVTHYCSKACEKADLFPSPTTPTTTKEVSICPNCDLDWITPSDSKATQCPSCDEAQAGATDKVSTYCSICSIIPVYGGHTVCCYCLRPTADYHHHICGDCSMTIMCDLSIEDCIGCGDSDLCTTCIDKRVDASLEMIKRQDTIIENHKPYSWDAVVYEGVATLDNGLRVSSKFDTYDDMLCWLAEHSEYGIVGWVDNVQIDALTLQNDVARYLESI